VGTTVVFFAVINAVKLVALPLARALRFAETCSPPLRLAPLAALRIWLCVLAHAQLSQELFLSHPPMAMLVIVAPSFLWDGARDWGA